MAKLLETVPSRIAVAQVTTANKAMKAIQDPQIDINIRRGLPRYGPVATVTQSHQEDNFSSNQEKLF